MNRWEADHIATGRALLRLGEPDLETEPNLWREVWSQSRHEVLTGWIAKYPGSRPPAWHKFDAREPWDSDRELECEYLARLGLLAAEEIPVIGEKAKEIVDFNRMHSAKNRLPDRDGLVEFARRRGLLT